MQFGILTFLRRPAKSSPHASAPSPSPSPKLGSEGLAAPPPAPTVSAARPPSPPEPPLDQPRCFHSDRYGYDLTLPAGWRRSAARPIPGGPPVDSFATADGAVSVGIWHEACPVRALPPVRERAAALPLARGFVVPFEAFTPLADSSTRYLEGRWLHDGRRWTINVQLHLAPGVEEASQVARVRELVKSVTLDRA